MVGHGLPAEPLATATINCAPPVVASGSSALMASRQHGMFYSDCGTVTGQSLTAYLVATSVALIACYDYRVTAYLLRLLDVARPSTRSTVR